MKKLLICALFVACSPPPITSGKCVVTEYENSKAARQICDYQGYRWDCIGKTCRNVGEVKGER